MRRYESWQDEARPENAQKNASWCSILTFWYTIPIFRMGKSKEMDESDLTKPLDEHKSSRLGERIAILWSKEVERAHKYKDQPNLTRVIFKCFTKDILMYGLIIFAMEMLVRLYQPLFLGLLLRYFNPDNKNNTEPYV